MIFPRSESQQQRSWANPYLPPLYAEVKICRSNGVPDTTHPVARMRSMTPKILRLYALWVGSDRPTPRGSGVAPCEVDVSPMDEMSEVVGKVLIDETEGVLLLWVWRTGRVLPRPSRVQHVVFHNRHVDFIAVCGMKGHQMR